MDFEAKVIQYLGETSGTNKAGKPWKKKEWVVETFGMYPRKVKIQCFGERADTLNIEPGRDYVFSVDLESREFNGRWYTDVSVFRIQDYNGQQNNGGQPSYQGGYQNPHPSQGFSNAPYGNSVGSFSEQSFSTSVEESDEDLPF